MKTIVEGIILPFCHYLYPYCHKILLRKEGNKDKTASSETALPHLKAVPGGQLENYKMRLESQSYH